MKRVAIGLLFCAVLSLCPPTAIAQSNEKAAEEPEISAGAQALMEQSQGNEDDPAASGPASRFSLNSLFSSFSSPVYPALGANWDAITFNENTALTGFFQIPPDPAGAAGPTHVVNVVNSSIQWYTKAGVRENHQSLKSFFSSAVNPPLTNTFDPKVIYDHYLNRFVVLTMERVEAAGATPNQSRVYLAVSDDSDPNGTWYFLTLLTEETIDPDGAGPAAPRQCWADFPGLAVDSEAVYFTTNMFGHNNQPGAGIFQGQRLWIMAKVPWYTGGAPVANRFDPAAQANANPLGEGAVATTMQPTQMYGDTPGGVGTYLIANGVTSGAGVNRLIQIIQVDNPLSATPTFTGYFSQWGTNVTADSGAGFPGAPQLGTTRTIATNDRRFSQHGVFRDGLLYCASSTLPPVGSGPNAGQVTARYYVLNPTVLNNGTFAVNPPPQDQGLIGGEEIAAGTHTFFPTVAVDGKGNMAVGFAASGPGIYPGAYYTMRLVDDAPGTTRPAGTLRAGLDYYVRAFSTSMTVTSRWGDYTGISVDPADDSTFWVYNEYALTRGTVIASVGPHEDGRWGTAWGYFAFACTIGCPDDITVPNDPGECGAVVNYPEPTFSGSCGNITRSHPSGSFFPVGTTTVTITGTRQDGSSDSCSFDVTVLDTEAPVVTGVSVTPNTLWPPNHQMVDIMVNYNVSDNCPGDCTLSVSSNEPVNGTGDGDTAPDWEIVDDHHVRLRAERSGNGTGRVYTITITCTDGTNTTVKTATVTVPKNQKK